MSPMCAGLSVYHLHVERLKELRPDVILTCRQNAHGAALAVELQGAALEAALGYSPEVCPLQTHARDFRDKLEINLYERFC